MKTVEQLLNHAKALLPRRYSPSETLSELAAGALVIDIRGDEQQRADGLIPGTLVICRNVLEWRCDPVSPWRHPVVSTNDVVQWSFEKITTQQFEDTKAHVKKDAADRRVYLESAFTQVIMDLQIAIQELKSKVLYGDNKVQEKILKKQERINELIHKKQSRLESLELMAQLPKSTGGIGLCLCSSMNAG